MSSAASVSANEKQQASTLVFPEGFIWGSATSSYQIEGGALDDGRAPSIWDVFCRQEGRIADGSNGDVACDHYNRYPEDVQLIRDLGLSAYRFSIAWPRVIPEGRGQANEKGLDFYDRLVDELLAAGIRPFPTLYHWDLPQILEDQGGWVERATAEAFAEYAEVVIGRLGDRIDTWTTLNEPFVTANHGYVTGEHAPGRTSMADGMAASHHLNLAHGLAGARIRELAPDARLAIVLNFTPTVAATDSAADVEATRHQHNLENRWYSDPIGGYGYPEDTSDYYNWDRSEVLDGDLDLIAAPIDLLGINYYTRQFVSADDSHVLPEGTPRNTMGWEIHPPSLGWLLDDLHTR
ncbi:MAG: family 1 glycosylhydrolase, partial [Actinomycetota bacterium]